MRQITEGSQKMSKAKQICGKMFAQIQWSDLYTSIIDLDKDVWSPKKEITEYKEGEYIEAKYKGTVYRAVISQIDGR